jgi:hypothetical protein
MSWPDIQSADGGAHRIYDCSNFFSFAISKCKFSRLLERLWRKPFDREVLGFLIGIECALG